MVGRNSGAAAPRAPTLRTVTAGAKGDRRDASVVHEAERDRQHARYRIPARVEVAGRPYFVRGWSVAGVGLAGCTVALDQSGPLAVRMSFDMGSLGASVELSGQCVWQDGDGSAGLRLIDLRPGQISALRQVIDAYLSGEIVTIEDLIHIARRENFGPARKTEEPVSQSLMRSTTKSIRWILMLSLLLVLLAFAIDSAYRRLFVVGAVSAAVDARTIGVRAPVEGYVEPMVPRQSARVEAGDKLFLLKLLDGAGLPIESPCSCTVLRSHVLPRQFVTTGESLMTLLPDGERPFVRVRVTLEELAKVSLGDEVRMHFHDGVGLDGRVSRVGPKEGDPPPAALSLYGEVAVEAAQTIALERIGGPVIASIDTFGVRPSLVSGLAAWLRP